MLASRNADVAWHKHTIKEVLNFGYRGPRIVEEIKQSLSDIIALQELDMPDFFRAELG